MKSIAVFCGSSNGFDQSYLEASYKLGQVLAKAQIEIVYGGAKVGLMGAVANGALDADGRVIGIIPHFLGGKEIAHPNLSELLKTNTMHERKMQMSEMVDGVITLPGGFGTMDELFEMLTWGQLGLHQKPIGILNINAFYDPLLEMISKMVKAGFLKEINEQMILVSDNVEDLLTEMRNYVAPEVPKWIKRDQV